MPMPKNAATSSTYRRRALADAYPWSDVLTVGLSEREILTDVLKTA
jgi:hypothetical protein